MTEQELKDFFNDIYSNNKTMQCLQYPIIKKLAEAKEWVKRDDLIAYFNDKYQQSVDQRGGLALDHLWSHRFGKGDEKAFLNKLVEYKPVKTGDPKTHYKLKKNIFDLVNNYLESSPIAEEKIKSLLVKRIEEVQLKRTHKKNDKSGEPSALTNKNASTKKSSNSLSFPLNQILYGPPGTGKTYNTINRALEIIGEDVNGKERKLVKDLFNDKLKDGQIVFTTFHQSMTYEDFIEGIKPLKPEGNDPVKYDVQDGIFKELCKAASNKQNGNKKYVLIIDEINRGNVSQIFGELITLIEEDKRSRNAEALSVTLPYSKVLFEVPSNLYIIGTMNTADRSVEALDAALRRRFSFEEMPPKPEIIVDDNGEPKVIDGVSLPDLLTTINSRIEKLLDKDHQIGHSYFLSVEDKQGLQDAFATKIIPLLQEYFFGDYGKIGLVLGKEFVERKKNDDKFKFADFDDYDTFGYAEKVVYEIKKINDAAFMGCVKAILNQ